MTSQALLCSNCLFSSKPSLPLSHPKLPKTPRPAALPILNTNTTRPLIIISKETSSNIRTLACHAARRKTNAVATSSTEDGDGNLRRVLQVLLWVAVGVYILWLFLLPYAPVTALSFLVHPIACQMLFIFEKVIVVLKQIYLVWLRNLWDFKTCPILQMHCKSLDCAW